MISRRRLLQSLSVAAGVIATNGLDAHATGLLAETQSDGAVAKARQLVRVGGRRVRTVDVWNHINGPNFTFPDVWRVIPKDQNVPASLRKEAEKYRTEPAPRFDPHGSAVQRRLADMDGIGIDVAVLSVGFNYWADRSLSQEITQIQNENLAALCSTYPERFAAFGALSLQHPDLAVDEMDEGVKKYKMHGFSVDTPDGRELSDPEFHPVWAKAQELGTVIDLHGGSWGLNSPQFQGHGMLRSVILGALGVTMALSKLIEEGTLDLFPDLKILAQRGGGYITNDDSFADRAHTFFPDTCLEPAKKHPQVYYLKRLYYNTVHQTSEDLRHLVAIVGASQLLLGTDNQGQTRSVDGEFASTDLGSPGWNPDAVKRVLEVEQLDDAGRRAILGGNATKLLGLQS